MIQSAENLQAGQHDAGDKPKSFLKRANDFFGYCHLTIHTPHPELKNMTPKDSPAIIQFFLDQHHQTEFSTTESSLQSFKKKQTENIDKLETEKPLSPEERQSLFQAFLAIFDKVNILYCASGRALPAALTEKNISMSNLRDWMQSGDLRSRTTPDDNEQARIELIKDVLHNHLEMLKEAQERRNKHLSKSSVLLRKLLRALGGNGDPGVVENLGTGF